MQTKRNGLRNRMLGSGLAVLGLALSVGLAGCQSSQSNLASRSLAAPQSNTPAAYLQVDIGLVTMRILPYGEDQITLRLEARRCTRQSECQGLAIRWVRDQDSKTAQNQPVRRMAFS